MYRMRLLVVVACLAGVVTAIAAPSASAIDPRYTRFVGCPDRAEIIVCIRADTPAGNIRLGNQSVPISQIVTLSGGTPELVAGDNPLSYNALGGITGNPLEVPGGLAGLTGLSEIILNLITFGANRVYAQAQLVGTPTLDIGTFNLKLPIKVNLRNPFLRSGCGIGSAASPINLNLNIGTTSPPPPARPISGHPPVETTFDPDTNITLIRDVKHVDNAFSVPGASGCDLLGFGLISGLIKLESRLAVRCWKKRGDFRQNRRPYRPEGERLPVVLFRPSCLS